jgi:hypothetical protein
MKKDEFNMVETLKSLGFIKRSDTSFNGYYKTYKEYKLWVARKYSEPLESWSAFILAGSTIITIPLLVTPMWVFGFDKENEGYLHDETL